jgi:hypothetical protein
MMQLFSALLPLMNLQGSFYALVKNIHNGSSHARTTRRFVTLRIMLAVETREQRCSYLTAVRAQDLTFTKLLPHFCSSGHLNAAFSIITLLLL